MKGTHLPQLRPIEKRLARGQQHSNGEFSEDGVARQVCFGGPFFGGCQICTVEDDDIHTQPRGFERLRDNWINLEDGFCASDDKRKAGVNEFIEDADDSTIDDDDSRVEDLGTDESCPSRERDPLQMELHIIQQESGDLFAMRGWDLVHVSRERYLLNGRSIKLFLLPRGAPLPYFTHIASSLGYDLAERASQILVCDGSLRQPLLDYLLQTGQNECYEQRGTENTAAVAGAGKMIDFNVAFSGDRMIEMKHATIQAEMRRMVDEEVARMTAWNDDGRRGGLVHQLSGI